MHIITWKNKPIIKNEPAHGKKPNSKYSNANIKVLSIFCGTKTKHQFEYQMI